MKQLNKQNYKFSKRFIVIYLFKLIDNICYIIYRKLLLYYKFLLNFQFVKDFSVISYVMKDMKFIQILKLNLSNWENKNVDSEKKFKMCNTYHDYAIRQEKCRRKKKQ